MPDPVHRRHRFILTLTAVAAEFILILAGSLLVTGLIYELMVRRVGAARLLFGMKPLRDERAAAPPVAAPLPADSAR